jgi:hypothetical protein
MQLIYSHYDQATGDHAEFAEVRRIGFSRSLNYQDLLNCRIYSIVVTGSGHCSYRIWPL